MNYLRDGELLCPKDETVREELLYKEAKFYQVQGIIEQLKDKTPSPGFLGSSLIIKNETHQSALQSWLPPNATFSLLYRASTDGYIPAVDFHRCCDNKGPNLVLIKSGEYIFGGYTSRSWESPSMQLIDNLYSIMIILIRALIVIEAFLRRKVVDHKDALEVNNDQMKRFSNHYSDRIK